MADWHADAREPPQTREETLDGASRPHAHACRMLTPPIVCAVLFDISQLLNTGLDRATLTVLVGLTESGVNPEALAAVVKELRRESAALTGEGAAPQASSSRASTEASAFLPPRS